MQLEHSFTVPVTVERAWEVLLDIERVAPCMPGAVLDSVDGDSFTGRVKIKLGPVNLTYKGSASFIEKDDVAHRAVIDAHGKDARGNGTAAAKVTATLVGRGESTEVNVLTDLNITGKPAQFGRGVMVDVGNKLIGQFATCLEGKLSGDAEEPVGPDAEADTTPEATLAAEAAAALDATADVAPDAKADAEPARPVAAVTRPAAPAAEPEPIDLLELAGGTLLTRAVPVAAGALLLAILIFLLRRKR